MRVIQYSRGVAGRPRSRSVLDTRFRGYDELGSVTHWTTTAKSLLLRRSRLRLGLQRLRIEADIEDIGIAGRSRRHRIHHIFGDQAERFAAGFGHRDRGPEDLGRDRLLLHAALHHGDPKRNLDRRRRSGRSGDDAALNADPRRDLAAVDGAVARGTGDRRLIAHVVADGLLARRRDGKAGSPRADADRRTAQLALAVRRRRRRRSLGGLLRLATAEQALEAIRDRLRRRRRGEHAAAYCERDRGRDHGPATAARTGSRFDHRFVTHPTSLAFYVIRPWFRGSAL